MSRTSRPTLFPYTTLFRSHDGIEDEGQELAGGDPMIEDIVSADLHAEAHRSKDQQIRCRSEEHTSELQSPYDLVCRLRLEKKNLITYICPRETFLVNLT